MYWSLSFYYEALSPNVRTKTEIPWLNIYVHRQMPLFTIDTLKVLGGSYRGSIYERDVMNQELKKKLSRVAKLYLESPHNRFPTELVDLYTGFLVNLVFDSRQELLDYVLYPKT